MRGFAPLRLALLVVGLGLAGSFPSPHTTAAVTNPYQGGGCTQWAWERWHELNNPDLPGNLGNAKDWADHAQADGLPVGYSAAPRSVAVFPPGTNYRATDYPRYTDNGHVAFVESVNPDGTFVTSNYWNPSYTTPDYVTFYPDSRIRFIYPETTPSCQETLADGCLFRGQPSNTLHVTYGGAQFFLSLAECQMLGFNCATAFVDVADSWGRPAAPPQVAPCGAWSPLYGFPGCL